jgi:hypothetical protein
MVTTVLDIQLLKTRFLPGRDLLNRGASFFQLQDLQRAQLLLSSKNAFATQEEAAAHTMRIKSAPIEIAPKFSA